MPAISRDKLMRGLSILCFLLVLPIFAALGHDIYVTYQDQDFSKTMMFSDVGYLWTNYEPDTYQWAQKNVDQDIWDKYLTPLLEQTSVLVASVPAVVGFSILLILRLFNLPPFASDVTVKKGHQKGRFSFGSGERGKGKMKYRRK